MFPNFSLLIRDEQRLTHANLNSNPNHCGVMSMTYPHNQDQLTRALNLAQAQSQILILTLIFFQITIIMNQSHINSSASTKLSYLMMSTSLLGGKGETEWRFNVTNKVQLHPMKPWCRYSSSTWRTPRSPFYQNNINTFVFLLPTPTRPFNHHNHCYHQWWFILVVSISIILGPAWSFVNSS